MTASSWTRHGSGWNNYSFFCADAECPPFPVTDAKLCAFVAWCRLPRTRPQPKPLGLLPATICDYIAAVVFQVVRWGLPDPRDNAPTLQRVLRGARKEGGRPAVRRLPITHDLLLQFYETLDVALTFAHAVMWALMCVCFWGLFRLGELAPPAVSLKTQWPAVEDLRNSGFDFATLFIRQSKTDPFRRGFCAQLFGSGGVTCPLRAVAWMRRLAPFPLRAGQPLFSLDGKTPVTKRVVLDAVARCLSAVDKRLGTTLAASSAGAASFRRGGATSLARAGAPDSVVQALGRWRSDAYKIYIQLGSGTLRRATRAVCARGSSTAEVRELPLLMALSDSWDPEFVASLR